MKTKQPRPAARPETRLLFNPFLPFTPTLSGNMTSFFPLDAGLKGTAKRGRKKSADSVAPH